MKMTQAQFDQALAAARLFDEFWGELRIEETMRKQWIQASDGFFYYVSLVERADAVLQ